MIKCTIIYLPKIGKQNNLRSKWNFFFLFTFFFPLFEKTAKKLQNYTSAAGDGGRDLPPCLTAVGGAVSLFSKICNLFV
jgi:hypothetical protein